MSPLSVVMHLVLDADSTAYETGPMKFREVVAAMRDGQYPNAYRVLLVMFTDGVGSASDVTEEVARAIFYDRNRHPIAHGGDAYRFVERVLSYRYAEMCAWEGATERAHERRVDMRRAVA